MYQPQWETEKLLLLPGGVAVHAMFEIITTKLFFFLIARRIKKKKCTEIHTTYKEMENNVKILEADNIASLLKELKCSETEF